MSQIRHRCGKDAVTVSPCSVSVSGAHKLLLVGFVSFVARRFPSANGSVNTYTYWVELLRNVCDTIRRRHSQWCHPWGLPTAEAGSPAVILDCCMAIKCIRFIKIRTGCRNYCKDQTTCPRQVPFSPPWHWLWVEAIRRKASFKR